MALEPIPFIVATEDVDRHSERVLLDGLDSKAFNQNPVGYYNHFRSAPAYWGGAAAAQMTPVLKWENLRLERMVQDGEEKTVLMADAVFDENDEFSVKIYNKVKGGFINTASIGFRAHAWSDADEDKAEGQKGLTFTKWELMEISIVDIPANQNAVAIKSNAGEMVVKSAEGIDKEELKTQTIIIKSFAGQASTSEKQHIVKKEKTMKKSTLLEKALNFIQGKGFKLTKEDGTPVDLKALDMSELDAEGFAVEIQTEAVKSEVEAQTKSLNEALEELKKGFESFKEGFDQSVSENVNKTLEEKDYVTTSTFEKLKGDVKGLKTAPSGEQKSGDGTSNLEGEGEGVELSLEEKVSHLPAFGMAQRMKKSLTPENYQKLLAQLAETNGIK